LRRAHQQAAASRSSTRWWTGFGGPTGEPQGRGDTTVVLNDAVSWLHGGTPWYSAASCGALITTTLRLTSEPHVQFPDNFLNDAANAFTTQLGSGNDRILQPSYDFFVQDSLK